MIDTTQFSHTLRGWVDTFIHRSMHDSARFIKASGFSMPQFFLLMQVYRHEHCGISDLSDHLEITNAASSQLVDKLVQAGLLVRVENPSNRRAKQISLSPAGEAFIQKTMAERSRWVDELAGALSVEEKTKVAAALEILNETMKRTEIRDQRAVSTAL